MTWSSTYNPLLTEALIDQLLGIICRDMQPALDFVSGEPGSLPAFVEYDLADVPIKRYPALLLTPDSESFDIESPNTVCQSPVRITAGIAVAHQVPSRVARLLQRYLRAFYLVIRSAFESRPDSFYSPLALPAGVGRESSAGLQAASLKLVWVESLAYDTLRRDRKSIFSQIALVSIKAELEEI
jgi:hypothetical protein